MQEGISESRLQIRHLGLFGSGLPADNLDRLAVFDPAVGVHLDKIVDQRIFDKPLPYCAGGFDEVIAEHCFISNERAGIRDLSVLVYHAKLAVFVEVRSQRERPALQRAHGAVTVRCIETSQEVHFPVPAVGKLVVFGVCPAPAEPFLVTGKELFLTGKKIDTEREIIISIRRTGNASGIMCFLTPSVCVAAAVRCGVCRIADTAVISVFVFICAADTAA